ncbi:hypothetical protein [Kitasatospora sp. HPMI-4]|uniref:hypothetical protein n=1 Tax=Kitasatospora sp. HPMI-4 TaxID=3448443 RepID=UPI003F1D73E8
MPATIATTVRIALCGTASAVLALAVAGPLPAQSGSRSASSVVRADAAGPAGAILWPALTPGAQS